MRLTYLTEVPFITPDVAYAVSYGTLYLVEKTDPTTLWSFNTIGGPSFGPSFAWTHLEKTIEPIEHMTTTTFNDTTYIVISFKNIISVYKLNGELEHRVPVLGNVIAVSSGSVGGGYIITDQGNVYSMRDLELYLYATIPDFDLQDFSLIEYLDKPYIIGGMGKNGTSTNIVCVDRNTKMDDFNGDCPEAYKPAAFIKNGTASVLNAITPSVSDEVMPSGFHYDLVTKNVSAFSFPMRMENIKVANGDSLLLICHDIYPVGNSIWRLDL